MIQSLSFQTLARQATVPTLNEVWAARASPVSSVTSAVTVNVNDGLPERSAFGEATGVKAIAKPLLIRPFYKKTLGEAFDICMSAKAVSEEAAAKVIAAVEAM